MSAHYTHEPAGFTRRTNEEDVLNIDGFGMTGPSRSLMADRSKDTKGHGGGMGFGILNDNGSDDDDGARNSTPHNPRSRALALGEAPLPGKSIFDFLSNAARERLVAASEFSTPIVDIVLISRFGTKESLALDTRRAPIRSS
ncbi:hypothetical protein HYQ46_005093 [Verticillium longisporum]|nr:hypothetical protein HYQ46_005093 [Verticillium longisporum]